MIKAHWQKGGRTNKEESKGKCINSHETIGVGAELITLLTVLRPCLVIVLVTIFINMLVFDKAFRILWSIS